MRRPFSILIPTVAALLLLAGCTPGDQPSAAISGDAVPVWGRFEHALLAPSGTSPRTDVMVHFTAPSGGQHSVRGFWDGENVWRVRFMPDEPGTWRFHAVSVPAVDGLHDDEGQFTAQHSQSPASPFIRHGAIRVSDNGRHFVHADGTPFFWLGDTAWNGVLLSEDEAWEAYLADRAEKHFSGIQFVTTQWRAALGDEHGRLAYTGFDTVRINPEFFQRFDERIDAIGRHGMLAAPVLLWALGTAEGNPGFLPPDEAVFLARYMVARYGANHVIWFLGGDGNYDGEHVPRWQHIGRGVFDQPGHAPVTLHGRGMQWPYDPYMNESWFTFVGYQSGHGDDDRTLEWIHSGPPAERWQTIEPVMPIVNLEPPYEDHVAYQSQQPHTDYTVRRAVWWSMLNTPIAGVTYGGHGIWSWEVEPRVPLNHERAGIARPWYEAMAMPGSRQMGHVAQLFDALPWWTLRPDQNLLTAQPGGDEASRFVAAARAPDGSFAVVYLPVGGSVTLRQDMLQPELRAEWYDPRTGTFQPADPSFTAPDGQDWVLVLGR
jgi:hypothetical protein